ncbi:MAG TPA: hypothetical protein VGQ78_05730 [Vicinamibacteria bacterium]|nr:hypothetical protein [Vicinamibacteria bacterium]
MHSRLRSEITDASALRAHEVERLYALHEASYDGVDRARFRRDLEEKRWVILLREAEHGEVVGFSTQRILDASVQGRRVRALFSGDTVIDPAYWGEQALVRAFCQLIGRLQTEGGDRALFWFLISKGHRTYLYLPTFFVEFWPRHDRPTPTFEAELIRVLGETRYPGEFDPATGLIRPRGAHDRLKRGLDTSAHRARNPHVAFFVSRNPGHAEGHELACVADLSPQNIRPHVRREVEAAMEAICAP